MGFWGIEGDDGQKYEPINLPEQVKHPGRLITVLVTEMEGESIHQWGQLVKILGFRT
jgi:hypothetical protein